MIESLAHLCRHYGLSPTVLVALYAAKVLCFWLFFALAVRSIRRKDPKTALLWGFASFCAAISFYTYILFKGSHLPSTAIIALCMVIAITLWGIVRKLGARRAVN
jgi:hypothetical protein